MKPYNTLVSKLFDAVRPFCTLPNKSPLVVFAEGPDSTGGDSVQDYPVLKDDTAEYFIGIVHDYARTVFEIDAAQFTLKQSHSSLLRKGSYKKSIAHSCTPRNLRRWMNNTNGRKKRCRVELCVLIYCWAVDWDSENNSDEAHRDCQEKILSICSQTLGDDKERTLIDSLWKAIQKASEDSLHSPSKK